LAGALCGLLAVSLVVNPQCEDHPATPSDVLETTLDVEERTVDYRWYDLFNVSFGEWWERRNPISFEVIELLTDSFPYVYREYLNETHPVTYSNSRLNLTCRNLAEVSMSEQPVFLPILCDGEVPTGGNATIDWYVQYLTEDEMERYEEYTDAWLDGWVVCLNGTVRLDEAAARTVMNVTSDDFDEFDAWWEESKDDFVDSYIEWILYEGNDRLDIWLMYGFEFLPLTFSLDAYSCDGGVILTYDIASWGMEALMTRWLKDAFMPTEWWFEDFTMHADIGPDGADIDIDTAVPYALRAAESKETGGPCWVWQGMLQDIPRPVSYWPWVAPSYGDLDHVCECPGSPWYGMMVPYEYTPGCFNLSDGESMSLIWPGEDILFLEHVEPFVTANLTGPTVIKYSEPLPSEMGDSIEYSPATRILKFEGPIDFWSWSKDQDGHENLSDEWDRVGLLPYGMPYLELSYWGPDTPPVAAVEARPSPDATSASQYVLSASQSCDSEDDLEDLQFRWDLDGDRTMDTDWASEPTIEHDFGGVGTFEVSVSVKDSDNMTDVTSTRVVIQEIDPPTTSAHLSGTEGEDGWYISWVTVELSAEDDSGIGVTKYRIDGGPWQTYDEELEVDADGVHLLEFFSVDVESNYEEVQETIVKVDMTPPEVSFVTHDDAYPSDEVVIAWTCTDSTSGFNGSMISLDGQSPEWIGTNLTHTYFDVGEGTHIVTLVSSDNAGNAEPYSYTFTVEDGTRLSQTAVLMIVIGLIVLAAIVIFALWSILRKPPVAQ
jgi:hypothetical protein